MATIISIGTSEPAYEQHQDEVKEFVRQIFPRSEREVERLLPVFENAKVEKRQFVVPREWFSEEHSFVERNKLYQEKAVTHSLEAIDRCVENSDFLNQPVPHEAIDAIFFVSSTGISTPSIDAYILNERNFKDNVTRVPIWGLGCAGGASGIARANEWLTVHPEATALVVCVELCSLTFQKNDHRKSNFIGTALFGDGISCALLAGKQSVFQANRKKAAPSVGESDSKMKKASLDVMGWNVVDNGLEVIFARSIPQLVDSFWREHVYEFITGMKLTPEDFAFFAAHPGGQKVLQAFEEVLGVSSEKFKYSYEVLKNHGNMSSATVLHVLKSWMEEDVAVGEKSMLSALGPGFSSELVSLEWVE